MLMMVMQNQSIGYATQSLDATQLAKLIAGEDVKLQGKTYAEDGKYDDYKISLYYNAKKQDLEITNLGSKNDVVPNMKTVLKNNSLLSKIKNVNLVQFYCIGKSAFEDMVALESVDFRKSNITEMKEDAFSGCKAYKYMDLPDTLLKIGTNAFNDCIALRKLSIPKLVNSIGVNILMGASDYVKIEVDKDNAYYAVAQGCLYRKSSGEAIVVRKEENKKTIKISQPEITKMNCYLGDLEIDELDLSESKIEELNSNMFYNSKTIKKVFLPQTCKKIGEACFKNSSLSYINGLENITELGDYAFSNCSLLGGKIELNEELKILGKGVFMYCSLIENVSFPENLETIEQYALKGCSLIKNITLPSNLKKIGQYAFDGCKRIENVEFPDSLEELGEGAFNICTSLKEIDTNKIKVMGKMAFANCSSLQDVVIGEKLLVLPEKCFFFTNIVNLKLGSSLKEIKENVFGKQDIKKIVVTSKTTNLPIEDKNSGIYRAQLHGYKDSVALSNCREEGHVGEIYYLEEKPNTTQTPSEDSSGEEETPDMSDSDSDWEDNLTGPESNGDSNDEVNDSEGGNKDVTTSVTNTTAVANTTQVANTAQQPAKETPVNPLTTQTPSMEMIMNSVRENLSKNLLSEMTASPGKNELKKTTLVKDKNAFANLKVTKLKCKQKKKKIKISFQKMTSAKKYEIRYSEKKNFKTYHTLVSKKTALSINKLSKNKTYYVKVRAIGKENAKTKWSTTKKIILK